MLLKKTFVHLSNAFLALSIVILNAASAQPKLYAVSEDWFVTVVDVGALKIVDDFEIIDTRVPPFEPRRGLRA